MQPPDTATVVDNTGTEPMITAGPFAVDGPEVAFALVDPLALGGKGAERTFLTRRRDGLNIDSPGCEWY